MANYAKYKKIVSLVTLIAPLFFSTPLIYPAPSFKALEPRLKPSSQVRVPLKFSKLGQGFRTHTWQGTFPIMPGLNIIAIDLGGTKIAGGMVKRDGTIYKNPEEMKAPSKERGSDVLLDTIADMIIATVKLAGYSLDEIDAIGIDVPGVPQIDGSVDLADNVAFDSINVREALETRVERNFGRKINIYLLNDMEAAAIGEARTSRFTYMTVSTGVNACRFNRIGNRDLSQSITNLEWGKNFTIDGQQLELLTNGAYIAERAKKEIKEGRESLILRLAGGNIDSITAVEVGEAANQGDELANEIFRDVGHRLGKAIVYLVDEKYPELETGVRHDKETFILGGGVTNVGKPLFDAIKEGIELEAQARTKPELADKIEIIRSTIGPARAIYGASVFVHEQATYDLVKLSTPKAQELTGILRKVLEEVRFDILNKRLRGMDYQQDAFLGEYEASDIRMRLDEFRRSRNPSEQITTQEYNAFKFFMLGESLDRSALEEMFGEDWKQYIDKFIEIGLFVETKSGKIRMNGLSLASIELDDHEVLYILADTPPDFKTQPTSGIVDVYIGRDSYILMKQIARIPELSGYVLDAGSGSGIQLIAEVKRYKGIHKAIGVEIDSRARNASLFNAYLNNVGDKVAIVKDEVELIEAVAGNRISFVSMNPPFVAMPDWVPVEKYEADILEPDVQVSDGKFSLRKLYTKAGWGGEDGLLITRQWIDLVLRYMGQNSQIVIFSQFLGDAQEPTKILDYLRSKTGLNYHFETLQWGGASLNPTEIGKWSVRLEQQIIKQNSRLKDRKYLEAILIHCVRRALHKCFQDQKVTHVHTGFMFIRSYRTTGAETETRALHLPASIEVRTGV